SSRGISTPSSNSRSRVHWSREDGAWADCIWTCANGSDTLILELRRRRDAMRQVFLTCLALSLCAPVVGGTLRIEHVTVVSPELTSPLRDATVMVEGDRIIEVGRGGKSTGKAEVLDGTGLFLTPGLIDSHVHTSDLPGLYDEQVAAQPQVAQELRQQ